MMRCLTVVRLDKYYSSVCDLHVPQIKEKMYMDGSCNKGFCCCGESSLCIGGVVVGEWSGMRTKCMMGHDLVKMKTKNVHSYFIMPA